MDYNNNKYPYDENQDQTENEKNEVESNQEVNHHADYQTAKEDTKNTADNQTIDPNNNNQQSNQTMNQVNQEQNNKQTGLNAPKKQKEMKYKKPKKARTGNFFSGLLGGVVSAVLIVGLLISGVLPIENFISDSGNNVDRVQTNDQDATSSESTQAISLDNTDKAANIDEVSEAVVGIKNMQKQDIWDPGQEAGSGSGIIYKKESGKAYIVTNNHVVENAKEVEVVLKNDKQIKANVLGTDSLTDLAVLEIDSDKVDVVASLGSSSDLTVGGTVVAIGNPLGEEFYGSVTRGIISGLDRSIEVDTNGDRQPDWVTEVLQTDAAINPGNSGGALVNKDGEVIGINSMKVARQAVEGIGFAIPIDSAIPIIDQLESDGEITRPFIGVSTASVNQVPMQYQNQIKLPEDVENGMVVANVESGSPADEAGLQQFDVITKINGEEIASTLDLRKYLYNKTNIGDKVTIEFYRDGKKQEEDLKLIERDV